MIELKRYFGDDYDGISRRVHVRTDTVMHMRETERRPAYGGCQPVTYLRFLDGSEVCVEGHVSDKIVAAQSD